MISQNFNSWLNYMHAIQGSGVMMHPVKGEEVAPVEPKPNPEPDSEPKSENSEGKETEEPASAAETQTVKKTSKSKITE